MTHWLSLHTCASRSRLQSGGTPRACLHMLSTAVPGTRHGLGGRQTEICSPAHPCGLSERPSDATCCAQSSQPSAGAPALDRHGEFLLELEAGLASFDAVVVKKSNPTGGHLGMLGGAACHAQSSGLGASAHALDRVGEFERELKAGLAWFDAQAVRRSGLVEDRALGAEEALGRLRAPSPPTPSDTPLRAIMITPLQLFPLTHHTASPNSVASAGDSTVIIEEPLASATHANLDTRQFSAQYVVQPNMVAPQDLQPCSRHGIRSRIRWRQNSTVRSANPLSPLSLASLFLLLILPSLY